MVLRMPFGFLATIWLLLAVTFFPSVSAADSTQSVIFADDFERGTDAWQLNGDWEITSASANQMLHGAAFSCAQAEIERDDYRFEARVRVESGQAKTAIRVDDTGAGYYLGMQAGGDLSLSKWDGSTWTNLGSDVGPYQADQWYRIALEGDGSHLRAYVDGDLKIEADDTAYASGAFMLNVSSGEADFDDIWVTGSDPQSCAVIPPNGLNAPFGLDFDQDGNILVVSAGQISRVTPAGNVSFFAQATSPGEIVVHKSGTIYIVSEVDDTIYTIAPDGSLNPFVTDIQDPWFLNEGPDGYLYASENWQDTVRIHPTSGAHTLWVEDLRGPMAFDDSGNVYLREGNRIYRIASNKQVTQIAELPDNYPYRQYRGLARDVSGNLYVGESSFSQNQADSPAWIPPELGENVYRITAGGAISTFATGLGGVYDLCFDDDGYLYATEHDLNGLANIAPNGTITHVVPTNGLATAHALAYGQSGTLYSMSLENYLLVAYAPDRTMNVIGSGFNTPSGDARVPALAFAESGALYTAEAANYGPSRISCVESGHITVVTTGVEGPSGLAFDAAGTLHTTEGPAGRLTRINASGAPTAVVTGLDKPQGMAHGPDGLFYIAELGAHRVTAWDGSGSLQATLPVSQPVDVAFADGALYVSAEDGKIWRRSGGNLELFASGNGNAGGIATHPDGGVAVTFGRENSVYRFAREAADPAMTLTAPAQVFAEPGSTITHTFTLHNVGNGRDGAWLTASSSHNWPVTLPGAGWVAPLPCGEERTIRVLIDVPAGAVFSVRDTLTLTATSRLDGSIVETAQSVTALGVELYLPLAIRDVDQSTLPTPPTAKED
jgi:hypothetical protein